MGAQTSVNKDKAAALLGKVSTAAFPCAGTALGVERLVLTLNVKWLDS